MNVIKALVWVAVSSLSQADIDKISLDEQERACRQWCETNNVQIVGVLRVPGYSRSESDVVTALEEFAAQGVMAYADLRAAWRARSFDVLVTYHSSRLGRSQSLYTYVVENTIKAGAKVVCILGGTIDEANAEFGIAFGGVQARGEQKRFIEMSHAGKTASVQRGLVWANPVFSHVVIRDERGKGVRLVPDERKRHLIDAAATLLLEGVPWKLIPDEMHLRWGYGEADGRPFSPHLFYRAFHSAQFWGHSDIGHWARGDKTLWALGEGDPVPDGVQLFLNTHEPFYTGEMADAIRTELRRRTTFRNGRGGGKTRAFSRLLICAGCHLIMSYNSAESIRCMNKYAPSRVRRCELIQYVSSSYVEQWIQAFLTPFVNSADIHAAFAGTTLKTADFERFQRQITDLSRRIERLASRLADVPDEAVAEVNAQMKLLANERTQLQARLINERNLSAARERERLHARRALDSIIEVGWDAFWAQEAMSINQVLHAVFGRWRLEVSDGQIVGLRHLD